MNSNKVIFVAVILILVYLLCNSYKPVHNDGNVVIEDNNEQSDEHSDSQSDLSSDDSSSYSNSTTSELEYKIRGLNNNIYNQSGKGYHTSSYRAQERDLSSIDSQYKVQDISQNNTDNYTGIDESDGTNANINVGNNKGSDADKYKLDDFLPKEEEKDWFETIETVDVKNSHLINIYKPIGVNTIGSSQKNATYDIRGTDKAVCPKFVVSPWMQSSIEPDRNMKSLC